MDFIDLGGGFLLTGFDSFESALSATEKFYGSGFKIAYLNETSHVKAAEVREYTKYFGQSEQLKHQRLPVEWTEYGQDETEETLATAVDLLEKQLHQKAKFILILKTNNK
jgi:hypothetical protein